MKKIIIITGIISLIFGCSSLNKAGRIYPIQMAETLSYGGFSIDRPIYHEWYLRPENQRWTQAELFRETESKCHSVYFYVALDTIRENGFDDYAENIFKKRKVSSDSLRFVVNKSDLIKLDSVTYKVLIETIDKRPINKKCGTLMIKEEGYIMKHQYLENTVLYSNFSERGTEEDFKLNYFKESKQLFKSLKQRKDK